MRRVVVLDMALHNTMLIGHDRYFLLEGDGRARLVRDRCPHRGGPLSLGQRTADGLRLTCPWHGTNVGLVALRRTALPMVRCGDEAVVVLPESPVAEPVSVIRREILANRPPDCSRADDCQRNADSPTTPI